MIIRSYPTYEEWKQEENRRFWTSIKSSYPTYEEWKPILSFRIFSLNFLVLILPMRNGNEYIKITFFSHSNVLILPMRNGNYLLWARLHIFQWSSYPTYEEWKPNISFAASIVARLFLSYLWGMETYWAWEKRFQSLSVLILPMRNGNNV